MSIMDDTRLMKTEVDSHQRVDQPTNTKETLVSQRRAGVTVCRNAVIVLTRKLKKKRMFG